MNSHTTKTQKALTNNVKVRGRIIISSMVQLFTGTEKFTQETGRVASMAKVR